MENQYAYPAGLFTRLGLAIIGANLDRTAWAGRDDQARFRLLALSVALLGAWVWLNVAHALVIATDQGYLSAEVLGWSSLIALLYMVVDLSLLQARLWSLGKRMAIDRGFVPTAQGKFDGLAAALATLPFALLRLILAASVAMFVTVSFGQWYWNQDISAQLTNDQIAVNAGLHKRIETELDHDIKAVTDELSQIETRMADRARMAQSLASQDFGSQTKRRAQMTAELTSVVSKLQTLDEKISCISQNVMAEDSGAVGCDGAPRIAGKGQAWIAANAELAFLQGERAKLAAQKTDLEADLAIIPQVEVIASSNDPEAPRRDWLQQQRSKMIEHRAQTVTQLLKADPTYVPPADGPVARLKALASMARAEPVVLMVMIVTLTMFIALDFSVLAIAFGRGPDSIYAMRQYVEVSVRAAEELADGQARMAKAALRNAQAQNARIQAELEILNANAELRAEMRRLEITEIVLDEWSRGLDPNGQGRPPFNA